jgi:hypothetical protein
MKVMAMLAVACLLLSGCAKFQRTEVIDTDKLSGFASGEYRENSSGSTGKMTLGGSGIAWGVPGGGFGAGWMCIETGPPKSGSYDFARSIAMINYSKKLKSIKFDEWGGVIDYEFEQTPLSAMKTSYQSPSKPKLSSSFGHQPVE